MKKNWITLTALLLAFSLLLSGCSGLPGKLGGRGKWQDQYDLGIRYLEEGDYEEAILAFNAAIEIDPNRPEAYMGRAEAYIKLDKPEEALKDYKRARRAAKKDDDKYDDLLDELEDLIEELEEWVDGWDEDGAPPTESLPVEMEDDEDDSGESSGWPLEDDWHDREEHYTDVTVTDDYVDALIDQYDQECCYHIPGIKLPNNAAADVNREISGYLMDLLENNEYDGYTGNRRGVRYQSIRYRWGVSKGMVSVVIGIRSAEYEWIDFLAYTVSVDTGREVSREELLAAYGMSEARYRDLARETLEKPYDGYTDEMIEMIGRDFYESLVESTMSDENLAATTPFIGPDGSLCMIAGTYGPAGAGFYWDTFDLEKRTYCAGMECGYPHSWNELPGVYHTPEEITRLVEQWCNTYIAVENGRFSASDQETWVDGNSCNVVIRIQNTDPDYRGEANVLFGMAEVDMTTGDLWVDDAYMGRLW